MSEQTTWTWQVSYANGLVSCLLDGRPFFVYRVPPMVSADGALAIWIHTRHVQVGERPAHAMVANGRRFLVEEHPSTGMSETGPSEGAIEEALNVMRGMATVPEVVRELWFIVDDTRYATPRVFRVQAQVVETV